MLVVLFLCGDDKVGKGKKKRRNTFHFFYGNFAFNFGDIDIFRMFKRYGGTKYELFLNRNTCLINI